MTTKTGNKGKRSTGSILFMLLATAAFAASQASAHDDDDAKYQEYKKKQSNKEMPPHKQPAPHNPSAPSVSKTNNLAEAATNPVANLIQFQLQNSYNWKNHNSSGYSNATLIQPIIPVKLPWEKVPLLITRTTIPYVTTPNFDGPEGRERGFGDTTILNLFTPKLDVKGMQVGLGPTIVIPTAGSNEFTGSGKWQAGPSLFYINMQTPHLQWGMLAYHLWDFADSSASGSSHRSGVSKLSLQPFVTYHLPEGWYVGSPDTPQTYDFRDDKWTWALGPVVGKVTKIGKVPVKLFGEVLYNPEDDAGPTAEWTAKVGITLLFPE